MTATHTKITRIVGGLIILLVLLLIQPAATSMVAPTSTSPKQLPTLTTMSTFYALARQGEITHVVLDANNYAVSYQIKGAGIHGSYFTNEGLVATKLAALDVPIVYGTAKVPMPSGTWHWLLWGQLLAALILTVALLFWARTMTVLAWGLATLITIFTVGILAGISLGSENALALEVKSLSAVNYFLAVVLTPMLVIVTLGAIALWNEWRGANDAPTPSSAPGHATQAA
jgi:hypothetical protein